MKKIVYCILTLVIYFSGCVSNLNSGNAAQSAEASGRMTLDQAIAEAAKRIEERITEGSKIASLNFNSSSDRFSAYVLDELTANLVDNGKLIVVDRSEIDLIRSEFNFQYSGEVGDDSMQALGRMLGAQSIISGSLTNMGGFYRIMIRVLNVQTASVEVQYRTNIISDHVVVALLSEGRTSSTATVTAGSGQVPTQSSFNIVRGTSLVDKIQWLRTNAVSNNEYIIEVSNNERISTQNISFSRRNNIKILVKGLDRERTISLSGNGSIFTIGEGVTLILDSNITLWGHNSNNSSLITVNNGGTLIMNEGAKIIGNNKNASDTGGGGVYVSESGIFIMNGGEISGNSSSAWAGGVATHGNFTMNNGLIINNTASRNGGGVDVGSGIFTMENGIISNNSCNGGGGGVWVYSGSEFLMKNGEILNNRALLGGGIYVNEAGTFLMKGGDIAGNRTIYYPAGTHGGSGYGGGVYVNNGRFVKTGGTIFGNTHDVFSYPWDEERTVDEESNIAGAQSTGRIGVSNAGHAVYVNSNPIKTRRTTTGSDINLDSSRSGAAGGWD